MNRLIVNAKEEEEVKELGRAGHGAQSEVGGVSSSEAGAAK